MSLKSSWEIETLLLLCYFHMGLSQQNIRYFVDFQWIYYYACKLLSTHCITQSWLNDILVKFTTLESENTINPILLQRLNWSKCSSKLIFFLQPRPNCPDDHPDLSNHSSSLGRFDLRLFSKFSLFSFDFIEKRSIYNSSDNCEECKTKECSYHITFWQRSNFVNVHPEQNFVSHSWNKN